MKTYREIVETVAAALLGRLLDPRRYNVATPQSSPCELRRMGPNPNPLIECEDNVVRLLCAVLLNLSGGAGSYTHWNAVSYRWLRYSMLTLLGDGGRRGRTLLGGFVTKCINLDALPLDKPRDGGRGDFHWALGQLLALRAVEIIEHEGEDYICPTSRILRFVAE